MAGNGWGGKRVGAGRKPGAATKKTREVAELAARAGCTPLEAILAIMKSRQEANDWQGALEAAKHAAPYIHPRLSAVESKHSGSVAYSPRELSTPEIKSLLGLANLSPEQRLELAAALSLPVQAEIASAEPQSEDGAALRLTH